MTSDEAVHPSEVNLANEKLARNLELYKSATDTDRAGFEEAINAELLNAIQKHPNEVNAVEVIINPGSVGWSEQFRKTFSHSQDRLNFETYARLQDGEVTKVLLPLPYEFSTGTHGSGQRKAGNAENLTIKAESITRSRDQKIYSGIGLQFEEPFMSPALIMFDAKEIQGIRLTKVDRFSPYLDRRQEPKLQDRPSPVQHYLNYKGFAASWSFEKAADYGVDPETFKQFAQNTSIGEDRVFLSVSEDGKKLENGFVAAIEDGKHVLYEFSGIKIKKAPEMLKGDILGRVWFDFKTGKKSDRFKDSVIRHEGDDVIKRLSKIESQRKF